MASAAGDVIGVAPHCAARCQAAVDSIDSENRCSALEKRAAQRAQADRSQADHRHGAAERNVGALGRRPAGGQVVGEQQRLLGGDRFGDLEQLEVGGGHGEQIGLCAVKHTAAEDLKAGVAHDRVAGGAPGAGAAAGHRRHHDLIANLDGAHVRPGFDDGAHRFVAKRHRLGERKIALVEVQVGSADAGGADFDDRSVGSGKRWIGTGFDPDAAGSIDNYRAHIGVLTFFVAQRIVTSRVRVPQPSTR